ncbi:MAG: hypothetical protein ONB46_22495 [candidate division KSB1 bacterium]|nr:hypothetical protein [candidate division KSB1 bacterium]MDZ7368556.1 hypothetical protein [candidate division KSB1 bacterium]MDZ7406406.1 hypothetical protein [candidate division KSB1 bacterium]
MQRAWQNCREGLAICRREESARQKALEFSSRARAMAPTHMQRWIEILQGKHADHVNALFRAESFFSLPLPEQAWWDQLIQSAPFAPVLVKQKAKGKEPKENNEKQTHMTLEQFDHICRAAAAVAGVNKVYVFGANAIIPWLFQMGYQIPLPDFSPSRELDVSVGDEKMDTLIDGSIGELSAFDQTFAVYAHAVGLNAFQAPVNWQQRTDKRKEPVSGVEIIVPHPHDLIISKLAAGRPKDFDFAASVARLFPMSDDVLKDLVDEFRAAHPQAEAALRTNVEIWRNKIS